MPGRCLPILLLLAALFGGDLPARADEAPAPGIRRLTVRYRASEARDTLVLDVAIPLGVQAGPFDPAADGVAVTIGSKTVISLPPVDARSRIRRVQARRWVYRERRSKDRSGVRRLNLDLGRRRLRLKARRLDLSGLRAAGPKGLAVVLTLGDTVMTGTVDLEERGRVWTHRSSGPFFASPPVLPGEIPPIPPPPAAFSWRILETGAYSAISTAENAVARDATAWSALWARHSPPMPPGVGAPDRAPPTVDITREIVVGIFLGTRPTGGYRVLVDAVEPEGDGARVETTEERPGPGCVVTQALTSPYVLIAVSRVPGAIAFSRRTSDKSCR